jgi:purine-binding chemotaxis protein CheW
LEESVASDVLVVAVDDRHIGLVVDQVQRVIPMVAATPLPGSPEVVSGVIDIAGELVAVVDPRVRFGQPLRRATSGDHLVVMRGGARTVAVWVDRAVELIRAGVLHPLPPDITGGPHIAGASITDAGLLVLIDIVRFLSLEEEAVLESSLAAAR